MVGSNDVSVYKSSNNSLGGPISSPLARIKPGTMNNMFGGVSQAGAASGQDSYNCMYVKNTHATENMDQFKWWMSSDTLETDSTVKWGLEPPIASGYRWSPSFVSDGTNKEEIADDPENRLTTWTIAAWFKTSAAPTPDEGWILNKGGSGSELPGENLMYGLWMTNTGNIRTGFETSAGVDNYATTPLTYHNGQWHFALGFYSGIEVKIYVDDMSTPKFTLATSAVPEASSKPLRINQNSRAVDGFFPAGAEIDEVRLWDRAMTASAERIDLMTDNIVNGSGLIVERKFGLDNAFGDLAQTIPNAGTAPTGIVWRDAGIEPQNPTVLSLRAGKAFPVWVWWHVDANAASRKDDACFFNFKFAIPAGGTGDPGGGSGGGGEPSGGDTGGNPQPTPTNYKIAAVGDWGCESYTDDVIDLINQNKYDFIMGLGDNAYERPDCWTKRMKPWRDKGITNMVYGNHEYSESGGEGPYKTFFGHNKTYFKFKFQNILFIIGDNYKDGDPTSAQYEFIKSTLEAADSDTSIDWKIVCMHEQWFSDPKSGASNDFNQVQTFMDLFCQHKVALLLVGHRHFWSRSHQVKRTPGDSTHPTVTSNKKPYTVNNQGFIQVISGTGGHDHPKGVGNDSDILYGLGAQEPFIAYQNNTHNGIWEMVASNNGKTFTCSFVEVGGDKFDTFVLNSGT